MEGTRVTMDPVNPAQPSRGGALAPPAGGEGYGRGEGVGKQKDAAKWRHL